jgi:hypothetical protein
MTAADPVVGDSSHRKPDGRALTRWRGQLASFEPRQLWVGSLDLRHLDAAARVSRPTPLDPFHRHVLAAVGVTPGATRAALDARLGLGPTRGRWVDELRDAGLVQFDGDRIVVTPRGERALAAGTYPHPASERRRFAFVVPGPHYVPWTSPSGPHDSSIGVANVGWVAECVARPVEWKRQAGFPEDVEAVEPPAPEMPPTAAWRRVTVARSERVPVVLAVTGSGTLYAFIPDAAGGLHADAPGLRMADGWREPFPELSAADDQSAGEDAGEGWRLLGGGRLRRAVHQG